MEPTITDLKIAAVSETGNTGVFSIDPLPTGYGTTLGNSLRRILLTSMKGAAITQVKFSGVDHQFSTIPGIKEDVVELTLNLKQIRFKFHSNEPVVVTIEKKGPGEVKASDIHCPSDVEVLNKNMHIADLADKNSVLKAELIVEAGTGYSPMEERQTSKIGVIVMDALFSPVINASFNIEPTRLGKITNLDKLILEVETDGSLTPSDAVVQSAEILKNYFQKILSWTSETAEVQAGEEVKDESKESAKPVESTTIDELPLQTRTINALKKQGIETLEELADKSDEELADIKNLGEKSIVEIKKLLKKEGFRE